MSLALLHRRLVCLLALSALAAFALGAGASLSVWLTAAALVAGGAWQPEGRTAERIERLAWVAAVAMFAWVVYVFAVGGDILPPILTLLHVLLVGEALRSLETQNDLRLYSLAFALMIAATAYFPGIAFAAAFVAFIVFATLALMVGHLRRQTERFATPEPRLQRSFLSFAAAMSGVTVLFAAAIFLAFPRLPHGLLAQGRVPGGAVMAGFSDEVTLGQHGSRIQPNPGVVFRVEFLDGAPSSTHDLYWKGRSFDHFDGTRWARSPSMPQAEMSRHGYLMSWGGPLRAYRIYGGPPGARVLFGLHPVLDVRAGPALRPTFTATGDIETSGWDTPVYTAYSAAGAPSAETLRSLPEGPSPAGRRYLQLPPLRGAVLQLADSLTRDHATRYDRARAVEQWLQHEFRYTLDLPRSRAEATIDAFLLERRAGHCEYFSTAMVMLLRAAGIPARNVTGFMGAERGRHGDYLAVTGNNAHSWVEVWFSGVGWVPFDPTPAAGREETLASTPGSMLWPLKLWFDGVQHQWHKWVLDYNLTKQLAVLQGVRDVFERAPDERAGRSLPRPHLAIVWVLAGLAIGYVLLRLVRGWAPERLSPESRLYRALRGVYTKRGFPVSESQPPLAMLERLRAAGAPGVDDAERLVELYLRARFGAEEIGAEGRAAMEAALVRVRRELRRAGGRRARRTELIPLAARGRRRERERVRTG
jgi:protein-glutamine gamma-glutamyltransferase